MTGAEIFWLFVLIVSVIGELLTLGLTCIWFAGGAIIAMLLALLNVNFIIQFIVFGIISAILIIYTRPIAVKYFNKDRVRTNVESLVGKQGIVIADIDNVQNIGQIMVNGQEWSARSVDESVKIPAGAVVEVKSISGVKLLVTPDAKTNNNLNTRNQPDVSVEAQQDDK